MWTAVVILVLIIVVGRLAAWWPRGPSRSKDR